MNKSPIDHTIENLKRNGFPVEYFQTGREALAYLLENIPPDASVGFGGSVTSEQLNIYEALEERGNPVFWFFRPAREETMRELMLKAAFTQTYISGANAITQDGRIVNMDGAGNRLSSILFGHEKVYLLAGVNKICTNYEEAILRIKNTAAPLNAKQRNKDTPCVKTGKCMNCNSKDRICNALLILEHQLTMGEVIVCLIHESLGL